MIGRETNPSIDGEENSHLKGNQTQVLIVPGENGVEEGITQDNEG